MKNKKKTQSAERRRKIQAVPENARPMAKASRRRTDFGDDISNYDTNLPRMTNLGEYIREQMSYRTPSGAAAFLTWTKFFVTSDVYESTPYVSVTRFGVDASGRETRLLSLEWDGTHATPCSACGAIRGACWTSLLVDAEYLICAHGRRFYVEYSPTRGSTRTTEIRQRGYGGVL